MNGIQLQLRRSAEREQAAEALADELQQAGSAHLHRWLTADQYAEQFGASPQDIATISEWLRGHGFTVGDPILINTTSKQMISVRWCCIHRLSSHRFQGIRRATQQDNLGEILA